MNTMARALFAMALAQAVVAAIAGSAWLFGRAARQTR